jgi:hypothetical protein
MLRLIEYMGIVMKESLNLHELYAYEEALIALGWFRSAYNQEVFADGDDQEKKMVEEINTVMVEMHPKLKIKQIGRLMEPMQLTPTVKRKNVHTTDEDKQVQALALDTCKLHIGEVIQLMKNNDKAPFLINYGGGHWAALLIKMNGEGELSAVYNDSGSNGIQESGNGAKIHPELEEALRVNGIHATTEHEIRQQSEADCGPAAVENLIAMSLDSPLWKPEGKQWVGKAQEGAMKSAPDECNEHWEKIRAKHSRILDLTNDLISLETVKKVDDRSQNLPTFVTALVESNALASQGDNPLKKHKQIVEKSDEAFAMELQIKEYNAVFKGNIPTDGTANKTTDVWKESVRRELERCKHDQENKR